MSKFPGWDLRNKKKAGLLERARVKIEAFIERVGDIDLDYLLIPIILAPVLFGIGAMIML